MQQQPEIVIYARDSQIHEFLEPYISASEQQGKLRFLSEQSITEDSVGRHLASGKVVWFDGFNQELVDLTDRRRVDDGLVICRIRGTEFLDTAVEDCRWEFFDRIVVANKLTAEILRDRFDRIDSHCRIDILPPAVILPDIEVRNKPKTKRIAYLGPISSTQNAQLLLQCLSAARHQHGDWSMHIIGEFDTMSLRIYFEQMISAMNLAGRIEFNPSDTNLTDWFSDKSYFLAPFAYSGYETRVYEAMAHGLKPVVHNFVGAAQMFEAKYLFNSVREFCTLVVGNGLRPQEYRKFVGENYDVKTLLPTFQETVAKPRFTGELPKVSVLVPTYNRAELLERLLSRLNRQTYANREIVVVDDCSSDNTSDVVQRLMPSRPDIIYYRNEVNQGNAATTGIAAQKATGDYLINCSDDDLLDDDALLKFVHHARRKNADVVYSDLMVVDGAGNPTSLWEYRDYYSNYELLRALIDKGGNLIPEVFMVKRELFEKLYNETYARRFLNTYYLPTLRSITMSHLPQPLYHYTVHQGSTFSSAVGLFDRCKSTQNFINAAMFMYSPVAVFGDAEDGAPAEQVARAYSKVALTLVEHGKSYFSGKIYTGAQYDHEDNLFAPYFHTAYHWLEMARRYGLESSEYERLLHVIVAIMNPREFDPVKNANMPAVYSRLPWFANMPFNNLSQFVALDIVTIGDSAALGEDSYSIYNEGKAHISVCNYPLSDTSHLDRIMSSNVITVINLFDRMAIEPMLRYLAERQLYSVYVMNFTNFAIPPMEMLRNVNNVNRCAVDTFEQYLELLTKITTTEHYAHPHLQTVS